MTTSKHSATAHSSHASHQQPARKSPEPTPRHEPAPKVQETAPAAKAADKPVAKAKQEVSVDGFTEQSRPERDRIAESVDRLIATIKAELDSDRLQGSQRNALTDTLERLQQQRNQLSTVPS